MEIQHPEGFFEQANGLKMYEQWWLAPDEQAQKGMVVIVHGLAEHSGRYAHVGEFFARNGFSTAALDHRGHGQSAGDRDTYINSFDEWIEDLHVFMGKVRQYNQGRALFMLGHSLGGLITATYAIKMKPLLNGVLLSGALLKAGADVPPLLIRLSGVAGRLFPRMPSMALNNSSVSRDPAVARRYDEDPLNYRGKIPMRTAAEMNRAMRLVQARADEFNAPVRIMFGTDDLLVDPQGSRQFFEKISSFDKTLAPYESLYHEIMNEPEKEQVLADMLAWMNERA